MGSQLHKNIHFGHALSWKMLFVLAIALGAIIWNVKGCRDSPMAFSPDGRQLAFVTRDKNVNDPNFSFAGDATYRLWLRARATDCGW